MLLYIGYCNELPVSLYLSRDTYTYRRMRQRSATIQNKVHCWLHFQTWLQLSSVYLTIGKSQDKLIWKICIISLLEQAIVIWSNVCISTLVNEDMCGYSVAILFCTFWFGCLPSLINLWLKRQKMGLGNFKASLQLCPCSQTRPGSQALWRNGGGGVFFVDCCLVVSVKCEQSPPPLTPHPSPHPKQIKTHTN